MTVTPFFNSLPFQMAEQGPLELRAIFTEHADGFITVRTEGIQSFTLEGNDFKDVMIQLVRTVNGLKKVNRIPAAFQLKSHLRIHFEE